MKDKFWRWYSIAFRVYVVFSSFAWSCAELLKIPFVSGKWADIIISFVIAVYIGSYLLINSRRNTRKGE